MAPEAEISTEQFQRVINWVEGEGQTLRTKKGKSKDVATAIVKGEKLTVRWNKTSGEQTLSCGKKQAREFEQAGIVIFPKPQRKDLSNTSGDFCGHA